jgi:hypothetical protein
MRVAFPAKDLFRKTGNWDGLPLWLPCPSACSGELLDFVTSSTDCTCAHAARNPLPVPTLAGCQFHTIWARIPMRCCWKVTQDCDHICVIRKYVRTLQSSPQIQLSFTQVTLIILKVRKNATEKPPHTLVRGTQGLILLGFQSAQWEYSAHTKPCLLSITVIQEALSLPDVGKTAIGDV